MQKIFRTVNYLISKQYRNKASVTVDTNYFNTDINKILHKFADRFEQFKTNKTVNTFTTNNNDIDIDPFEIDTGSL